MDAAQVREALTSAAHLSQVGSTWTARFGTRLDATRTPDGGLLPYSVFISTAVAADWVQWAQGYSGWLGVAISGSQPGSGVVAGLPSSAALRIAVIGRQKL